MKYAELKKFDASNSPYVGSTLFVSGCNFHCKSCFNEVAQDFNYGNEFTKEIEDKFISYLQHPQVKNANILGGEPMQQDSKTILHLVQRIKNETNCDIWLWTGELFENLIKRKDKLDILNYVDILVDGQFIEELKDLRLKYRGSSNQRVIKVKESLQSKILVLYSNFNP